jgi:hypothetical protein
LVTLRSNVDGQGGTGIIASRVQILGIATYKQVSTQPMPTGDVTVTMLFEVDTPNRRAVDGLTSPGCPTPRTTLMGDEQELRCHGNR